MFVSFNVFIKRFGNCAQLTKALNMSPDCRASTRTDICTLFDMLLPTITLKIYHIDNAMATGGVSWSRDHVSSSLSKW